MKNNNLLELKKKFIEIRNMGWVTATRLKENYLSHL